MQALTRDHRRVSVVVLRLATGPRPEAGVAALAGGLGTDMATAVAESAAAVRSDLEMELGTD